MKKIISISALLLLSINLFSIEPDLSFDFSTSIGLKPEKNIEQVYDHDVKISELTWQTDTFTSPTVNIDSSFSAFNIFIDLGFSTAVPVKSGSLVDLDFLCPNPNDISNYSKHELFVDKNYSFAANLGYDFKFFQKKLVISPFGGGEYINKKFTGHNGYLQYPDSYDNPWTGEEEKTELNGPIISYEQSSIIVKSGLGLSYAFNNFIKLQTQFTYYPYVMIDSIDNHFLRSVQFYDKMNSGNGFNICFNSYIGFSKTSNKKLKIGVEYNYFQASGFTATNTIGKKISGFVISPNCSAKAIVNSLQFQIGFYQNFN